ncbi:MAG: hypothetical protein HOP19_29735 [Acidobacteria bacterium]|nr:hypothetical protein [Acidobacteriota bacterium]
MGKTKTRQHVASVRRASKITTIDAAQITTKRCLCGGVFQPTTSFVVTAQPVVTITRVCADCADTLGTGSFAERLARANLLLRRVAESEARL